MQKYIGDTDDKIGPTRGKKPSRIFLIISVLLNLFIITGFVVSVVFLFHLKTSNTELKTDAEKYKQNSQADQEKLQSYLSKGNEETIQNLLIKMAQKDDEYKRKDIQYQNLCINVTNHYLKCDPNKLEKYLKGRPAIIKDDGHDIPAFLHITEEFENLKIEVKKHKEEVDWKQKKIEELEKELEKKDEKITLLEEEIDQPSKEISQFKLQKAIIHNFIVEFLEVINPIIKKPEISQEDCEEIKSNLADLSNKLGIDTNYYQELNALYTDNLSKDKQIKNSSDMIQKLKTERDGFKKIISDIEEILNGYLPESEKEQNSNPLHIRLELFLFETIGKLQIKTTQANNLENLTVELEENETSLRQELETYRSKYLVLSKQEQPNNEESINGYLLKLEEIISSQVDSQKRLALELKCIQRILDKIFHPKEHCDNTSNDDDNTHLKELNLELIIDTIYSPFRIYYRSEELKTKYQSVLFSALKSDKELYFITPDQYANHLKSAIQEYEKYVEDRKDEKIELELQFFLEDSVIKFIGKFVPSIINLFAKDDNAEELPDNLNKSAMLFNQKLIEWKGNHNSLVGSVEELDNLSQMAIKEIVSSLAQKLDLLFKPDQKLIQFTKDAYCEMKFHQIRVFYKNLLENLPELEEPFKDTIKVCKPQEIKNAIKEIILKPDILQKIEKIYKQPDFEELKTSLNETDPLNTTTKIADDLFNEIEGLSAGVATDITKQSMVNRFPKLCELIEICRNLDFDQVLITTIISAFTDTSV